MPHGVALVAELPALWNRLRTTMAALTNGAASLAADAADAAIVTGPGPSLGVCSGGTTTMSSHRSADLLCGAGQQLKQTS